MSVESLQGFRASLALTALPKRFAISQNAIASLCKKSRFLHVEPNKRFGFRVPNPCSFLIGIGVGIIRVEVTGAALFLFVRLSDFRMRAQIVPESEVTCYFRRIRSEEVQLGRAVAVFIGERAITPSRYAKLTVPIKAQCRHLRTLPIEPAQIGNDRH